MISNLLQACLALALSGASGVRAQAEPARSFAIVIGNNSADDGQRSGLRYADDDAISTHRLLTEASVNSALLVVPDRETADTFPALEYAPPTSDNLERAIERAAQSIGALKRQGRETEFFLFYSGHGDVENGEGYVNLADSHLTRTRLHDLLTRVGATRNHVVIDACRSYFLVFERSPGGSRRAYNGPPPAAFLPSQLANTGFLLSTASDRESHEWERFRGGIFSHEVRSALRGAADLNRDGIVTYAELGAFVQKANERVPTRFQPDILVRPPWGSSMSPLLYWRSPVPVVSLRPADWGHLYLETGYGERLVDLHPQSDSQITIRTPSGGPLFLRRHDESAEYVLDGATVGFQLSPEAMRAPTHARRGALNLAFESLFATPVGPEDVARFGSLNDNSIAGSADAVETHSRQAPIADDGTSRWSLTRTRSSMLGAIAVGLFSSSFAAWLRARSTERVLMEACGSDRVCPPGDDGWRDDQRQGMRLTTASRVLVSVGVLTAVGALVVGLTPRLRKHNLSLRNRNLLATQASCPGTLCGWRVVGAY